MASNPGRAFLCPRCRAGCCEAAPSDLDAGDGERFYALDVGLGVARLQTFCAMRDSLDVSMPSMSGWVLRGSLVVEVCSTAVPFLCPRCRAGCCEARFFLHLG